MADLKSSNSFYYCFITGTLDKSQMQTFTIYILDF